MSDNELLRQSSYILQHRRRCVLAAVSNIGNERPAVRHVSFDERRSRCWLVGDRAPNLSQIQITSSGQTSTAQVQRLVLVHVEQACIECGQ